MQLSEFDLSKSHDFTPSEDLIELAKSYSQGMDIIGSDGNFDDEATLKMRKCKHDRLWRFTKGFPSDIVGCCDCDYWHFL